MRVYALSLRKAFLHARAHARDKGRPAFVHITLRANETQAKPQKQMAILLENIKKICKEKV